MNESTPPTAPPIFTDGAGRRWPIKLTLATIDHVLATEGVDLAPDDNDVTPIVHMTQRSRQLAAVLWRCIEKHADAEGVTRDNFLESLGGEELAGGREALLDAVVFFIQSRDPTLATAVRRAIATVLQASETAAAQMAEWLDSPAAKQLMAKQVRERGERIQADLLAGLEKFATDSEG